MSTIEIVSKIEALKEWEALAAEAAAEIEALKFTTVQSSRFDTKRFKNELGEDVYKRFCKGTISRRFTISG